MGEILPFPFRQVGSAGQIRIGSLAGGVDIDIFFYFVTEENVGRIYYFSPHPANFLVNMNPQPIHSGKPGNKMGAVDGPYDFDVVVGVFVGKLVQYLQNVSLFFFGIKGREKYNHCSIRERP